MALDDNREASDVKTGESDKKSDLFHEQGLGILQAIYSGAIDALPSSFCLRTRFMEILLAMELAHSEEMQEILADMKRDFSKDPEYWDWLARVGTVGLHSAQEMSKEIMLDLLQKAIQIYEEALRIVPTAMMFNLYTKILVDATFHKNGAIQNSALLGSSADGVDSISHILMVYEKAERLGCIAEDLVCQHVTFLLELGRLDEARNLAEKLCSGKLLDAVRLWVLQLSIKMICLNEKSPFPSKADLSFVFELFIGILMKASISKAESLWVMLRK